jgi:hypothetical protein
VHKEETAENIIFKGMLFFDVTICPLCNKLQRSSIHHGIFLDPSIGQTSTLSSYNKQFLYTLEL